MRECTLALWLVVALAPSLASGQAAKPDATLSVAAHTRRARRASPPLPAASKTVRPTQPAQPDTTAPDSDLPSTLQRMMDKLELGQRTRDKLAELTQRAQQRAFALRMEAERAKQALKRDLPDAEAIRAQLEKVAQLKSKLSELWQKARAEAVGLLTPAQRDRWKRMSEGDLRAKP
jgi:Spy/CpxP family protein refolding chaperone